jgi:hypothetical protein
MSCLIEMMNERKGNEEWLHVYKGRKRFEGVYVYLCISTYY